MKNKLKYIAVQSCQLWTMTAKFNSYNQMKNWCIFRYNETPVVIRVICIDKVTDEVVDAGNASDFFDLN